MKHFAIVFMQWKVLSFPVISQQRGPVVLRGGESIRRGKIFCARAAPRRPIMQMISFVNSTPNVGVQLRPSSAVWNVSAFSYWIRFQLPSIWARFALIHCLELFSDRRSSSVIHLMRFRGNYSLSQNAALLSYRLRINTRLNARIKKIITAC